MLRSLFKGILDRGRPNAGAQGETTTQAGQSSAVEVADLLREGYTDLLQSDHTGAMEAAREVLSRDPQHPGAHLLIAQASAAAGDLAAAENWVTRLLALKPDNADAHYVRGTIWEEQANPRKAIEAYDRALELDLSHAAS